MSRAHAKLTVGELRAAMENLPDEMQVSIEVETALGDYFTLDTPTSLDVQGLDHAGAQCFVIEFEDAEEA